MTSSTNLIGNRDDVLTHCNDANVGLLESRNNGAEVATGDVVAFIDDDAIADEEWVAALVDAYEQQDALAVGGRMTPAWVAGKPSVLSEEFYWLVGCDERGFGDGDPDEPASFGTPTARTSPSSGTCFSNWAASTMTSAVDG